MTANFILAQIMGAIWFVFSILADLSKENKNIIRFHWLGKAFYIMQYILLGALTGALIGIMKFCRYDWVYYYQKKGKKPPIIVFWVLTIVTLFIGYISLNNIWGIFSIISALASVHGLCQNDAKLTRKWILIAIITGAIYSFAVGAYIGGVSAIIRTLVLSTSIYRFDIIRKPIATCAKN